MDSEKGFSVPRIDPGSVVPDKEEGLFAGTSTGGNVAVALRCAERLGAGATVVTVMCDTGMKYLSTSLYRDRAG